MESNKDSVTIDLKQIFKLIVSKWWLIGAVGVLTALIGFSYASFFVKPTYVSSVSLYVNNSGNTDADKISSSDLSASQSLVKTYGEILDNRSTLELVIQKAGLSYTYQQLSGMITSGSRNNTEVMEVTVTAYDPDEAALIANCIAEVLPIRIAAIIDGTRMEIVDSAIPNPDPVAPSVLKYTALGLLLGVFAVCVVLCIREIMDDKIHGEDYILHNYECPVLANIPDLMTRKGRHYGYYRYYGYGKNTEKAGKEAK